MYLLEVAKLAAWLGHDYRWTAVYANDKKTLKHFASKVKHFSRKRAYSIKPPPDANMGTTPKKIAYVYKSRLGGFNSEVHFL
ncbi:hypothetical protein [Candidatus Nitrotoga sp. M5]|uniref:hypothetical protein n=1 Tax=Candidatus Nitrotoga sp. M5 TaxID=2890409 RepID=UPI001EF744D2|nr:hypothetical protein [Candidatus Nitrotoga sp. M5]